MALIPSSSDGYFSDEERARLQQLVAMGDKIYPLLCAKLLETDDFRRTGVLIGILSKGNGNPSLPRATFYEMLRKWHGQSEEVRDVRRVLVSALGKIGVKEDAPILLSLLDDPALPVRITSLEALAKIGDESTTQQIESWITQRKASLNQEHQQSDVLLKRAAQAVSAIRARPGPVGQP